MNFDVSADARSILVSERFADTGLDIMLIDPSTGRVTPYVRTRKNENSAVFSPDGKWVAYSAGPPPHTIVRRFPDTGEQWQVAEQGGWPKWSRDGRSILYLSNGMLMTVPVKLGPTFEAGPPQKLFPCDGLIGESPDGKRFLVSTTEKPASDNSLLVVLNWPRMLENK